MIDVNQVIFNALWVTGCAVILAVFSQAHWLAHRGDNSTRQLLGTPAYRLALLFGLGLVAAGLFFLSQGWLEHAVWAAFFAVFAWQAWRLRSGFGL